jgi:hypothetical protein
MESWSYVRGSNKTFFDFHVEPGCLEMERACAYAPGYPVVHVNGSHLGVQRNPYVAINCAFDCYLRESSSENPDDFVILAEDDMVVGTDTLEYFKWAERKYRNRKNVLGISAARREQAGDPPLAAACTLVPYGVFWVWGTWRDRWQNLIAPDWMFNYEHKGWDWRLDEYWCRERGMKMLTPNLSRVQHIGREGGTHVLPSLFEGLLASSFLPDVEPQQYYVVNEEGLCSQLHWIHRKSMKYSGQDLPVLGSAGMSEPTWVSQFLTCY